jgi:RES domain-containing protein
MKLPVWRIVKAKYADSAFSGEGAARAGGRWNSRGEWVVYASGTLSLAALELLVHLNPPVHFEWIALRAEIDTGLVESLDPALLPPDWQRFPATDATRAHGDAWLSEGRSAVLAVPSVIVPGENNYLINPAHPDFRKITVSAPEPFAFDSRLLR